MRSTPCYVGHLTDVLGLSSIAVWSSSTVVGSTRTAGVCSEHYSISEQDLAEAAMQDAARRALPHYCLVLGRVADGFNLKYYPVVHLAAQEA
jgi:hypothetical protein